MELFKLLGTIAVDTEEANQAIDETTDKARNSEQQQSGAFQKIGGAAIAGAKVIAGAATAIGGAWIGAIEGTREYRVSMGMLETAFTTAGHSAGSAKSTYTELNAVLGDTGQATEAAQQLAKLTDFDFWRSLASRRAGRSGKPYRKGRRSTGQPCRCARMVGDIG